MKSPFTHFENTTEDSKHDGVTIVTGYFNLGAFQKGENPNRFFSPDMYKKWMRIFSKITNPVVAYFDNEQYYSHFVNQRQTLKAFTQVHLVKRDQLWSFQIGDNISAIYRQPYYPSHHPNTVVPEYSCAMHAKYELMLKTIQTNPFGTKYFAWLDIGLFRGLNPKRETPFHIHLPPDFNQSRVAYSLVYGFDENLSDVQIFYLNQVWVCGCFFIGREDIMQQWTKEYLDYVAYFIAQQLMNTDQQVVYAIHNNHQPQTYLQVYGTTEINVNKWFYLGYLCKS